MKTRALRLVLLIWVIGSSNGQSNTITCFTSALDHHLLVGLGFLGFFRWVAVGWYVPVVFSPKYHLFCKVYHTIQTRNPHKQKMIFSELVESGKAPKQQRFALFHVNIHIFFHTQHFPSLAHVSTRFQELSGVLGSTRFTVKQEPETHHSHLHTFVFVSSFTCFPHLRTSHSFSLRYQHLPVIVFSYDLDNIPLVLPSIGVVLKRKR